MALRQCSLSIGMGASPVSTAGARRPRRRSTGAIIVAAAVAAASMYAESSMINGMPASTVACNSALVVGLSRALEAGFAALSPVQQASSL